VNFGNGAQPSARTTDFVTRRPVFVVTTVVSGEVAGGPVTLIGGPDETCTAPDPPLPRMRSAAPTMCDKPVSRLIHAIGRKKSIATVLRSPSGEPSAEFISVGASRTVHTTKQRMPAASTFFHEVAILFGGPPPPCPLWSGSAAPVPPAAPECWVSGTWRVGSSVRTVTPDRGCSLTGTGLRSIPDLPAAAPRMASALPPAARPPAARPLAARPLAGAVAGAAGVAAPFLAAGARTSVEARGGPALRRRRNGKESVNVRCERSESEASESEVDEGLHSLRGKRGDAQEDRSKYGALCQWS